MGVRWWLGAMVAAAVGLAAGCAADGSGPQQVASLSDSAKPSGESQTDNRSDEDKMREFAKCMREHGIEMDDPQVDSKGGAGIGIQIEPGQKDQLRAAEQACKHLLPNGGRPPQLDPEDLDKMREFTKCLREHGLDVPDPDPNEPGIRLDAGQDPEKADQAMEACEHLAPGRPGDKKSVEPTK
jgi:hypothetical protein